MRRTWVSRGHLQHMNRVRMKNLVSKSQGSLRETSWRNWSSRKVARSASPPKQDQSHHDNLHLKTLVTFCMITCFYNTISSLKSVAWTQIKLVVIHATDRNGKLVSQRQGMTQILSCRTRRIVVATSPREVSGLVFEVVQTEQPDAQTSRLVNWLLGVGKQWGRNIVGP